MHSAPTMVSREAWKVGQVAMPYGELGRREGGQLHRHGTQSSGILEGVPWTSLNLTIVGKPPKA